MHAAIHPVDKCALIHGFSNAWKMLASKHKPCCILDISLLLSHPVTCEFVCALLDYLK